MTYEKTLAACRIAENAQWQIGDALITECGSPGENGAHNGSVDKLADAAKAVAEAGLDYAEETLRRFRTVANAFAPGARVPGVSFSCHHEAGTPDRLQKIIAALPEGTKITRRVIREMLDHFANRERAQRVRDGKPVMPLIPSMVHGLEVSSCTGFEPN